MVIIKKTLFAAMAIALLASCKTPSTGYFQDVNTETTMNMVAAKTITMQPGDKVSIVVNSKNAQLAAIVNLPIVSQRAGYANDVSTNGSQHQISAYTIDGEGNIDFPQLGKINIKGLSRQEVADLIKERLKAANLIQDPVVIVEFMNLHIGVLGEVKNPGRFSISNDHISVLDALSLAGDLTIYGERCNVKVLRTEGQQQHTYLLDLTNDHELVNSPAYYLQQDDIVYVTPNVKKSRESVINGNNVLSTSFWISIASLAASITTIILSRIPK